MTLKHHAIVLLRVLYKTRVLLCVKKLVLRYPAIASGVLRGPALKFDKLRYYFAFA